MSSTRSIDQVREHLFDALEGLADKDRPLDLDRAKAISEVAQTIINSAKVEVEFLRATGNTGSRFLGSGQEAQPNPDPELDPGRITSTLRNGKTLPAGIVGIRQHRIAG